MNNGPTARETTSDKMGVHSRYVSVSRKKYPINVGSFQYNLGTFLDILILLRTMLIEFVNIPAFPSLETQFLSAQSIRELIGLTFQ